MHCDIAGFNCDVLITLYCYKEYALFFNMILIIIFSTYISKLIAFETYLSNYILLCIYENCYS